MLYKVEFRMLPSEAEFESFSDAQLLYETFYPSDKHCLSLPLLTKSYSRLASKTLLDRVALSEDECQYFPQDDVLKNDVALYNYVWSEKEYYKEKVKQLRKEGVPRKLRVAAFRYDRSMRMWLEITEEAREYGVPLTYEEQSPYFQ